MNGCTMRVLDSVEVLLIVVDVEFDLMKMSVTFEGVILIDGWVGRVVLFTCRSVDDWSPALVHGATTKRPSFDPRGENRAEGRVFTELTERATTACPRLQRTSEKPKGQYNPVICSMFDIPCCKQVVLSIDVRMSGAACAALRIKAKMTMNEIIFGMEQKQEPIDEQTEK